MSTEDKVLELEKKLNRMEFEHNTLKNQLKGIRQQMNRFDAWLDTINSPIYKRIWWFLQGYRFYRLGRWYGKNKEEHHYY
jgi:hypothetical protein